MGRRKGEPVSEAQAIGLAKGRRSPNRKHLGGRSLDRELMHDRSILGHAARDLAIRNPAAMQKVLDAARLGLVLNAICMQSGINRNKLGYWLKLSRKGRLGDGFDMPVGDGRTERFHVLFAEAWDEGSDFLEEHAIKLSRGIERKILTNQQGVIYEIDPDLIALGFTGAEAYLRDQFGKLVPQSVPWLDPETLRWMLAHRRPEQYGTRVQHEVEHKGGVLVVSAPMSREQYEKTFQGPQKIIDVEFEEIPSKVDKTTENKA